MKLQPSVITTIIEEVFDKFSDKFKMDRQVYDIDCFELPLFDDYTFSIDAHIYCAKDAIHADFGSLQIFKGENDTNLIELFYDADEELALYDQINGGLKFKINDFYNEQVRS